MEHEKQCILVLIGAAQARCRARGHRRITLFSTGRKGQVRARTGIPTWRRVRSGRPVGADATVREDLARSVAPETTRTPTPIPQTGKGRRPLLAPNPVAGKRPEPRTPARDRTRAGPGKLPSPNSLKFRH